MSTMQFVQVTSPSPDGSTILRITRFLDA